MRGNLRDRSGSRLRRHKLNFFDGGKIIFCFVIVIITIRIIRNTYYLCIRECFLKKRAERRDERLLWRVKRNW